MGVAVGVVSRDAPASLGARLVGQTWCVARPVGQMWYVAHPVGRTWCVARPVGRMWCDGG